MRPIPNARQVFRRAWSVRLILIAAALGILSVALEFAPAVITLPIWAQLVLALSAPVASIAALVARLLVQKDLSDGSS